MKDNTKLTFKHYFRAVRKHWLAGIVLILAIVLATLASVFIPFYFKKFFDFLISSDAQDIIVQNLLRILIFIVLLEGLQWLGWRIATFAVTRFQTRVMARLTNRSFAYLHQHSFKFFDDNFVGTLVKRVKWFTRAFEIIADMIIWRLLPLLVRISAIVIILALSNYLLAVGVFVWTVFFLVVNYAFTKFKLKYDIARAKKESESTGLLADTITNNKSLKLFNGFWREVKGFAKVIDAHRRLQNFTWDLNNYFESFQGLMVVGLEIGILYLAIRLWQRGVLTPGDFVLIQVYMITIFYQIWDFGKVMRRIYEALADAEEMTQILETPHEIVDHPHASKLKTYAGEIEFRHVDFYYRKTRKVFEDFNLKIKSHERVALIGPSGSGKTTVVKILLRMHNLTQGKIMVDSQDISRVTQKSLRQAISLVPQDPILFHRSLWDNIRYGNPRATKKEILAASRKAHCQEFITQLPEGYDTYVGERGIKLSGGERQRIAIARAILHDTPILVLDEATSSLDSESERYIQKAIDALMQEKTVIVIAHRLSTIRKMDRIIVIDQGKIIEEGSHEKLIAQKKGIYSKLWKLQAGGFID